LSEIVILTYVVGSGVALYLFGFPLLWKRLVADFVDETEQSRSIFESTLAVLLQLWTVLVSTVLVVVFVPSWKRGTLKALPLTLVNICGTGLILYVRDRMALTSMSVVTEYVPTGKEMVCESVLAFLFFEVIHYFVHRLLHTKRLFRNFHGVHHRFREEVPLAAYFSHPVDFALSNSSSLMLAWTLVRQVSTGSVLSLLLYLFVAQVGALYIHTGHGLFSSDSHAVHHAKLKSNFGLLGVMDLIFGTKGAWISNWFYAEKYVNVLFTG
jgi:sterol desaturase/sphingolipid hydroxylase (fatty acid hydroxylase superfamily)